MTSTPVSPASVSAPDLATVARKVVVHSAGGHDHLKLETARVPLPRRGEVRIAVRAIGVNYADTIVRQGLYASAKEFIGWPITPGFEVAGVVEAIGEGIRDLAVGTEVVALTLFGGYASHVVVDRAKVFRRPAATTFEQAAAVPAVYLTAWYALFELAHPRKDQRVLVHSAAGGVGSALVQMAKLAGCEVTAVVGATSKVAAAKALGADHVIDKSNQNLWRVAEAISPEGFDVVLDANGITTLAASYDHLARPGKLVVYGFHSMMQKTGGTPNWPKLAIDYLRTPRFNPLDMTNASRSVLAFNLSYLFDRDDLLLQAMTQIMGWLEAGTVVPPTVKTYPLADVARAHADIESGLTIGKLVLLP
jgi:NADPH:quinone reductase-like Zn-dependent oxidoreductase